MKKFDKKGVWNIYLVAFVLALALLVLVLGFIFYQKGYLGDILDSIRDFFRFGGGGASGEF